MFFDDLFNSIVPLPKCKVPQGQGFTVKIGPRQWGIRVSHNLIFQELHVRVFQGNTIFGGKGRVQCHPDESATQRRELKRVHDREVVVQGHGGNGPRDGFRNIERLSVLMMKKMKKR